MEKEIHGMKWHDRQFIRAFVGLLLAGCLYSVAGMAVHAADLSQYFDTKEYADTYPDLKEAFGYDSTLLLDHYFIYGIDEGRVMTGTLDVKGYRASNTDLDAAFGNDWRAYAEHYAEHGRAEGRTGTVYKQTEMIDVDSVIWKKGSVPNTYMDSVRRYWAMLPETTKQDFMAQGWHVEVTSEELHLEGYSAQILAITSFNRKTIFLSDSDSTSVVHEMGHYVDWRHGMCHNNIPDDMYQSEKPAAMELGGGSAGNYCNKQEYLAECYWLYFKDNEGFKKTCPETYAFIQANML